MKKLRIKKPKNVNTKTLIGLGVLAVLLPITLLQLFKPSDSEAWFDDSFGFRKKVPITNSSGSAQIDFQVELSLDTASLISEGKMQSDCDDLRFTDNNGAVLSYWLEPGTCNSATTKVHVKVPSIPTSGADIYWYYGNEQAGSQSDTGGTFIRDMEAAAAAWPLDDTTTTQSYARVVNSADSEGRDMIINGTFDTDTTWTKGTGWTISGGVATHASGTASILSQSIPLVSGKAYTVTYTISGMSAGSITGLVGAGSVGTTRSANGTYTEVVIAGSTYAEFRLSSNSTFDGSIDNVSVKQVNIPGSAATPTQLLADGDMEASGTNSWTAANSATLSKETTSPHGGSQVIRVTYNTGSANAAQQSILTVGNVYRVSGYMRGDGTNAPDVRTVSTVLVSGTSSTSWQPFDKVFIADSTNFRLANANNAGYVEFDDVVVSLDTGIRQGEIAQDTDMEQSGTSLWTVANSSTLSKQTTNPHGGSQVLRVTYNGGSSPRADQSGLVIGKTYRATVYGRGDGTWVPRINNGTTLLTNGTNSTSWQLLDITFVAAATTVGLSTNASSAGYAEFDDFSVTEVSPLIGKNTNGVAVGSTTGTNGHLTNAYTFDGSNDNVNIYSTDLNSVFNPSAGTAVAWFKVNNAGVWTDATNRRVLHVGVDGSNQINLTKSSGNNQFNLNYIAGGTNTIIAKTSFSPTDWVMVAMTWDKNADQFKAYVNGVQEGSTQTGLGTWSGNLISTAAVIGSSATSGGNPWSGQINDVRLYDRALSAEEIALQYSASSDIQAYTTDNFPERELFRKYNTDITVGAFASEEIGAGPVAWWKFDEGTGTTTQDATTNNNDGTISGATWQTEDECISGKCLSFDGDDDYVSHSPISDATTNFSVSMWIKPTNVNTWQTLYQSGTATNYWRLNIDSNGKFDFTKNSVSDHASTTSLIANQWNHIEVVKSGDSGTNLTFYINGKAAGTASVGSVVAPSGTAYLGAPSSPLNGIMDEPKIYTYARSAAQVKADYSMGAAVLGMSDQSFLSDGLVGYWKMDETSWTNNCSTDSVLDSSGNNNHGDACPNSTGPTGGAAGKFGNGGSFDGTNDYISLGSNSLYDFSTGDFTLSAWVKQNTTDSNKTIFFKGNPYCDTCTPGYGLYTTNGVARFVINPTTASGDLINAFGTTNINGTQWNLVTVARSGNTIVLLINGVQDATASIPSNTTINDSGTNLFISQTAFAFNGQIDEARIYNRSLSPHEVRALYNWAPGPVGYWKMDEGTGTSASDSSGNGNTGTITGASWNNGKFGNALSFNGSSNLVTLSDANNLTPSGGVTISAWVKKNYTSGVKAFYSHRADTTNRVDLFIGSGSSANQTAISFMGVDLNCTDDNSTNWRYYSFVFDDPNNLVYIYRDGVLLCSGSNTTALTNISATPYIGHRAADSAYFNGLIDDFKYYNYARTPGQIIEDMQGGSPVSGSVLPDPIAHYKFDEQSGQTVDDAIGSNNGTLGANSSSSTDDPTWKTKTDCKVNGCLSFDGGDVITGTDTEFPSGTNPSSISLWFKYDGTCSNRTMIVYGTNSTGQARGISCDSATGIRFFGWGSDFVYTVPSTTTSWHHVVGTFDGSNAKLYYDGVYIGSNSASWSTVLSGTFYIGRNITGGNQFSGLIDEVKIYNTALSVDQVKQDFVGGSASFGGVLSASEESQDISSGNPPVGIWEMDEKTGSSASDKSGNNLTGTISGARWTNGKVGSALEFDGDDSVSIADNSVLNFGTSDFTLEAWIKPNVLEDGNVIFSKTNGGSCSSTYGFHFATFSNYPTLHFCSGGGSHAQIQGQQALSANQWQHIAVSVDRDSTANTKVYVNGKPATTSVNNLASHTGSISNTLAFTIASETDGTDPWIGGIDQVRIYNYARSAAQVAYDYNGGEPVAWWRMDNCQGTTVTDHSGNGNHGTLTVGASGTQTTPGTCTTTNSAAAWSNGASGKYNGSLNFDASNDYVDTPLAFQSTGGSISLWAYPTTIGDWKSPAGWKTDPNVSTNGYVLFDMGNASRWRAVFRPNIAVSETAISSARTFSINNWYHLTMTWSLSGSTYTVNFYVDGKLQGTSSWSGSVGSGGVGTFNFGKSGDYADNYFGGKVDDVRVYNYSLSAAQVRKLYNNNASVQFSQ